MTGTGMLCHEGSSPPQSKPSQPRPLSSSLVLDIAGLAAVTDNRLLKLNKGQLVLSILSLSLLRVNIIMVCGCHFSLILHFLF